MIIFVYISKWKRRAIYMTGVCLLWAGLYMLSGRIVNSSLSYFVTINNYLTISYPIHYQIDSIYYNEDYYGTITTFTNSTNPAKKQGFVSHQALKGNFSFMYPEDYIVTPKEFEGSEILYHVEFSDRDKIARGFVQVWNFTGQLDTFLAKSKQGSMLNFLSFAQKKMNINGLPAYLWDYAFVGGDGKQYKGMEAFIQKGPTLYRLSYFVPLENWGKKYEEIFWKMVNSFKLR